MSIGKWAIALFLICLLAYSMLAVFVTLKQDQSQDDYYKNATSTVNKTVNLTETVTTAGTGFITPLTLVVAIMFLLAVFLIFRSRW